MCFFNTLKNIFADQALNWLGQIKGKRAMVVSDQQNLYQPLFLDRIVDF